MSRDMANIFGRVDTGAASTSTVAEIACLMYRIGAYLERADRLRQDREAGRELSGAEQRLVALTDELLEVGIEAFAEGGKS